MEPPAVRFKYEGTADAGGGADGKGIRLVSMEVSNRPGSPNDDRQEMSSLPRGIMLPGVRVGGTVVLVFVLRI